MDAMKKGISLLVAILLLASCASALLLVQTPVLARDSGDFSWVDDEKDLKNAVNDLKKPTSSSTEADKDKIQAVAARLSHLTSKGKRNVSSSVIKKLAEYYNTAFGISPSSGRDDIDLDSDEKSSREIDEADSYAYGVSATFADKSPHTLKVFQDKTSGSVLMDVDLDGFDGPIYVYFKMEKSPYSSSGDYYMKWDGYKIDATVKSNSVSFIAPGEGTYKLYKDKKSSDDDDDDDDYYRSSSSSSSSSGGLDSFWKTANNNVKSAAVGERVRVSLGTRTTVPTEVLKTLKGKDVTLALYESNGNIISIYGKDVTVPSGSSVSVDTLRSTYDKDASTSTASSSSAASGLPGTGGLSALPNGIGSTVAGGTTTPNAGGAPTAAFPTAPITTSPRPVYTPPVSSSSEASSESSSESSSEESSSSLSLPTDFRGESQPEAEKVAIQEPVQVPQYQDVPVGSSRIQRVLSRVGTAGVLVFMGMVGLTAALGGGLLTYAVLSRKDD